MGTSAAAASSSHAGMTPCCSSHRSCHSTIPPQFTLLAKSSQTDAAIASIGQLPTAAVLLARNEINQTTAVGRRRCFERAVIGARRISRLREPFVSSPNTDRVGVEDITPAIPTPRVTALPFALSPNRSTPVNHHIRTGHIRRCIRAQKHNRPLIFIYVCHPAHRHQFDELSNELI